MAGIVTISTVEAARLLGITAEWVRRLARDGVIPKPEKNRVPLVAAVQGYIRWLKDDERRAAKMSAQTRVAEARAREIELRVARMERGLIPAEDVERDFAAIMTVWRTELAVVAGENSNLAVRAEVENRTNDAIERAERRFEKAMNALGGAPKTKRRRN